MSQIISQKVNLVFFARALLLATFFIFITSHALAHPKPRVHTHCKDNETGRGFNTAAVAGCPQGSTATSERTDGSEENTPAPGVDDTPAPGEEDAPDDNPGNESPDDNPGNDRTTSQSTPIKFQNPIAFNTVDGLLAKILTTIQSIVAVLAILFIIIGAIIYITSGGNQQRIELAKNAIFAALIGLALALAAPSFLKEIYTAIGGDPTNEINEARSLTEIALNITRFLLSLVGVLAIVMLVSGGIIYILSAGDQSRTDIAKRTIVYAIIGLVVALVSLVIVGQVVGVISGA